MSELDGLGYRGKTVVITGASSGMGDATARILAMLGARLHIVDIQEPKASCEAFHSCDLADPDRVARTVKALSTIGPIDFVFACAGVPHVLGALRCMKINFIGTRQLIEGIIPAMRNGGGIAIISSDAGMGWQKNLASNLDFLAITDPVEAGRHCEEHPETLRDGYSSSKEMLMVWVQSRCISLGQERGIRINTTAPCPTKTAFTDVASQTLPDGFWETFPYPLLGRMATSEEQAWPLILLNSPLNNVVTGAVIYTDQGFAPGLFTGALDAGAIMGPATATD